MRKAEAANSRGLDFFISYTKPDLEWAKWITWELENEGYTCCVQFQDFRPGSDFMQAMRTALKNARQTVALLSPDYLESEYAQCELNAALRQDPLGTSAVVVPIRVRSCEPREILEGRIYIDLVGKAPVQAKKELLDGIAASRLSVDDSKRKARFDSKPHFPVAESDLVRPSKRAEKGQLSPSQNGRGRALPVTVLFVASEANTGLDLRGQFRQLRLAVKAAPHGAQFHFRAVFDATPERLFEALNGCNPTIVHFSGKQDGGNILMNTERGGVRTISDSALAGLLRSIDSLKLAIIDTCSSLRCATAVSETVDAAIGVKSFIYEEDATSFYCAFYRALACGKSLREAAAHAAAKLAFKRVPKQQIPQLRPRRGLDPKEIFLLA